MYDRLDNGKAKHYLRELDSVAVALEVSDPITQVFQLINR